MAYNSNTNKSLLCTDELGETWEWDGINWSRLYPTGVSPSTRYAGMAYDSHRDNFVLFGGDINGEYRGSTWIFNGTQWVEKNLTSKPSQRGKIQLVYDSHRDRVVLFGGEIGHFEYTDFYSDETWEWDGATWLKREPALHPPAISMYSMAYDSHRHCTVLYGGITQTGFDPYHPVYEENHDIWEWDGSNLGSETTGIQSGLFVLCSDGLRFKSSAVCALRVYSGIDLGMGWSGLAPDGTAVE